jgi:integrase
MTARCPGRSGRRSPHGWSSTEGRGKLSTGWAWHYHKSLRQLLTYAVDVGEYVATNVATKVENAKPKKPPQQRENVEVFTLDEVFAIAEKMPRDDLHLRTRPPFASVSKAYSDGELKEMKVKKTWAVEEERHQERATVDRPRDVLRLLVPGPRSRRPATATPYAMRHTYASWSIAAGIPVFQIAERMGRASSGFETRTAI